MITPAPGYIVDPNNPNGVIRDPGAVATAPGTSPTVPTPTVSSPTGDAQVLANQKAMQALGIKDAPGVGGGSVLTPMVSAPSSITPEDQKLLALGITPEQLKQLGTPEGLDPTSFQNLIGNVENKLKTNNDLVTTRGYLMKQLYDSPLTDEEKAKLPEDIKRVVDSGDKDTIQLQLRLMNDQISGRANTLSQSIKYLADSYQTHYDDVEKQRDNAIGTVVDFVGQYGSKAPEVLSSLYGPSYLEKLKGMGIDIKAMAAISTIAQDRESRLGSEEGGLNKATPGFADSKIESSVREDATALLDDVEAGTTTLDKVYKKLRTLYSQSEVSDDAIKSLLGMKTSLSVAPSGGSDPAFGSPYAKPMGSAPSAPASSGLLGSPVEAFKGFTSGIADSVYNFLFK